MRRDIDEALQGWPYEPEPGEVIAREVRARDGRNVLQIRIELGLLQCSAADREFTQFYHRRVAWLTLQRYDKALLDADHSIALMDFVRKFATDADYIASHERYRGLVLFHRTQAAAALARERRRPEEAIDAVREGMDRLVEHQQAVATETDDTPNDALIEQLRHLEREIRKNFAVEKTLREQLDEAVADEDYELAARIRDQIKAQARR
jgi:hypothetical protein